LSHATGPGGSKVLPLTGTALVIGGTAVPAPTIAAIAAAVVIGGFLLLWLVKPASVGTVEPGRPGRARPRVWRRGAL
jgi:hypothetical protein